MTPIQPSHPQTRRNRWMLLAIVGLFFGSLLVAGVLRFSGWRPAGTLAHGELLQPPGDLRALSPSLSDGGTYRWDPGARLWRIAIVPPAGCTQACVRVARQVGTVWRLLGQDSDRVHVLWIGNPPPDVARGGVMRVLQDTPALRAGFPRPQPVASAPGDGVQAYGVWVYLVDPNGFVVMRYRPGFDPGGLRTDLSKLLKLM